MVSTRTWKWAGEDGEEEVDEDGNATAWVGPFRVGEGAQRFGHDGLGSVTSQSDGVFTSTAEYSAWGQISTAGAMPSSAAYAGGRVESPLGLNYNRRRWLDSTSGTFLSRDDLGATTYLTRPNGIGASSYSGGNPLINSDPDGRDLLDWAKLIFTPPSVGGGYWLSRQAQANTNIAAQYAREAPAQNYEAYEFVVGAAQKATDDAIDNTAYDSNATKRSLGAESLADLESAASSAVTRFVVGIPFGVINTVTRPHRVVQGIGTIPSRFVHGVATAMDSNLPVEARVVGASEAWGAASEAVLLFASFLKGVGINGRTLGRSQPAIASSPLSSSAKEALSTLESDKAALASRLQAPRWEPTVDPALSNWEGEGGALSQGAQSPRLRIRIIGDSNLFQDRPGVSGTRAIADSILADESIEILVPRSILNEVQQTPTQLARIRASKALVVEIPDPDITPFEQAHAPTRAGVKLMSRNFSPNDALLAAAADREGLPVLTTNYKLKTQIENRQVFNRVRILRIGKDINHPLDIIKSTQ
ncbi:MAG: hypothetical protein DI536_35990 [Archangium gephyra]|uniref:PIN domain-containing protein n=1 Tax=Archangium gephyra TaxID=48 RepID=A0A2W5SVA5_9BACT|nr:MAG: hypothetical protein DI536_35990 [Archangium gephyra]